MPMPYRKSAIAALMLSLMACSSSDTPKERDPSGAQGDDDEDDDTTDDDTAPTKDAGKPDAGGAKMDASVKDAAVKKDAAPNDNKSDGGTSNPLPTLDSGVEADPELAECQATLKKCNYDEKETACGALTTTKIPLTAGGEWGGLEIPSGPHGAFVEWNEGAAFKNPTSAGELTCDGLASAFGEPASVTADVLNLRGADLSLYTVFRPACMREGETYPVITWGNGTCGQTGGYAGLLATLASHGYVVFASNSRWTNGGNNEMLKALDFAKAENENDKSPLYKRLDLSKVGAMGHSQGASATAAAAKDERIKSIILWNGASSSGQPAKPFLTVSGDRDINSPTVASLSSFTNAAKQPGAWLFYHKVLETGGNVTGHLTLMEQPERVTDVTIAWWDYQLKGDQEARKQFVGDDCGLCNKKDDFEYGAHNLP